MNHNQLKDRHWPKEGLERVERCPICGEVDRTLLYDGLRDDVMFCAAGYWTLYRCNACEVAFLDPRPTAATISLAYSNYHTHNNIERQTSSWFSVTKKAIKNGYINDKYRCNLTPSVKIGKVIVPLLLQSNRINESIRHIPAMVDPGRLADIGCGNGQFLHDAIQLGWECYGLDFDPLAVEAARKTGANVALGGFPDTELPSCYFNMVTLSHVIEHVHDPLLALKEIYRILKPGGLLWIATPNIDSLGHNRFRRFWRGIEAPRHVVLFNRKSLKLALIDAGFKDIVEKPCYPQTNWFYKTSLSMEQREEVKGIKVWTKTILVHNIAMIANIKERIMPSRCENIVIVAKRY